MATCANCSNDAVYTYQPGPEFSIHYCPYHLPKFLTRTENPAVVLYKEEVKITDSQNLIDVFKGKSKKSRKSLIIDANTKTP
jgi:hypothetical protein